MLWMENICLEVRDVARFTANTLQSQFSFQGITPAYFIWDVEILTESILCGSFRLVNSLPTATCAIFPTRLGRFVFSYWWKFSGSITLVRWKHYTDTSIHLFQATSATYHVLFLLTYLHEIALLV